MQHVKRHFLLYIFLVRSCLAKKNPIFLEIKTTQNKPKGCLSNTSLNQRNLNKKKKQQIKQGLLIDPVLTRMGWPDQVNLETNQNKDPNSKQIQYK
jgi:hypothetical protein